jgi:DNA-directed RNA polymerase specialized sigma subunit
MSSTLIRINEDLKKVLDQHIKAFEETHGATLTMSQMIKKLLDNYNDKPPAAKKKKITAKKILNNRKAEILKLYHQQRSTTEIAKSLGLSTGYCREVIRLNKDTLS